MGFAFGQLTDNDFTDSFANTNNVVTFWYIDRIFTVGRSKFDLFNFNTDYTIYFQYAAGRSIFDFNTTVVG